MRDTIDGIVKKVNKDQKYTLEIQRENIALRISHVNISSRQNATTNKARGEAEISVFSSEQNNRLSVKLATLDETLTPEDLSVIRIPKTVFSDPDKLQSIASVVYKNTELFRPDLSTTASSLPNLVNGTIGSVVHSLVIGDESMDNLPDPITLVFKKINTNDDDGVSGRRKGYYCAYWVQGDLFAFAKTFDLIMRVNFKHHVLHPRSSARGVSRCMANN